MHEFMDTRTISKPSSTQNMNIWEEYFFNKSTKILYPCDVRLEQIKEKNIPVEFFCLHLDSLEGIFKRLQVKLNI